MTFFSPIRRSLAALLPAWFMVAAPAAMAAHPVLYAGPADLEAIQAKIHDEAWAARAWKDLLASIDPLVARTQADPQWVVSRMAMYWKDGERYTQCYLKKENWDRGEGNAPVPTVRLPGMRTWNDFINVPLEDRIPFNETGDMRALSRKNPSAPPVIVSYGKSGHLVRQNNVEILTLAEKAAFAHWITGDEKYARFAADIYWAWLLGTCYMNPPLDPGKSSGGPGGYEPGGILGYYDYEQIHDDLMMHAASIYDFLHDYLKAHPHPHLSVLNKDPVVLSGEVFKRFIDIGFVRGGRNGNWNVNGWNIMMRGILTLEPDAFYPDGRGRDFHLKYYTSVATEHHDALPDILKQYDPVTGLWPESPGYAFGTINTILDLAIPIQRAGVDTIAGNPMMRKAALAVFPWLDPRGNLVVIGDMRGGPGSFLVFERLLTYYQKTGDVGNAAIVSSAIRKGIDAGQYDRGATGWEGICANQPLAAAKDELPYACSAWSAEHRHLVMKNLNGVDDSLMFTLYGGTKGKHLTPNGLALQLYGKGWALSPDASAYESYWSEDVEYHQGTTGSNTILPGYAEGPVILNALEPAPGPDEFATSRAISPNVSFADVSAAEKRRLVAIIRTSPKTGYYVDVFRSKQQNNDYLHHNIGTALALTDASGKPLRLEKSASLEPAPHKAYRYFNNAAKVSTDVDFRALWTIGTVKPNLHMAMWMKGGKGREVFQVDAPPTNLNRAVSPGGASIAPNPTPTLIVRQRGTDGWKSPFVAVFEPYAEGGPSVGEITSLPATETFTGLIVASKSPAGRRDFILNSVDDAMHRPVDGVGFQGVFGVVSENGGKLESLYLGHGRMLERNGYRIESAEPVSACLILRDGTMTWSATAPAKLTLPAAGAGTRTIELPAGYGVPITIADL